VLAGRADVASLAYLYWAENLVIAFYAGLRVLYAGRGETVDKVGAVGFFALWIGGVSVFLGRVLIGMLLNPPRDWDPPSILGAGAKVVRTIGAHLVESGMVLTVLALVVSHGIAFRRNYLGSGEFQLASANHEIARLMNRGVVTFGIAFVAIGFASLNSPAYVLAALVIVKTGYEIWRYGRDRQEAAGSLAAGGVS
jgi:hypothetical protein